MRNNGAAFPMMCRLEQLDLADIFQAATQENFLRCRIAWVGVRPDRFETESPEAVMNDGCSRFTRVSVSPIGLTQPITKRRLVAAVTRSAVETHAADQTVGFLQRNGEAVRATGGVVLLHAGDPLAPIRFGVRMRYRTDPAGDFPTAGQRHKIGKVVVAVCSHSQPC